MTIINKRCEYQGFYFIRPTNVNWWPSVISLILLVVENAGPWQTTELAATAPDIVCNLIINKNIDLFYMIFTYNQILKLQRGNIRITCFYSGRMYVLSTASCMTEKEVDSLTWGRAEKRSNIQIKFINSISILWHMTMMCSLTSVNIRKCDPLSWIFPNLLFYQKYEGRLCHSFSGGRDSDVIIQSELRISHSNTNEQRGAMSGCEGSGSVAVLDETRVPSWFAFYCSFVFTGDFL